MALTPLVALWHGSAPLRPTDPFHLPEPSALYLSRGAPQELGGRRLLRRSGAAAGRLAAAGGLRGEDELRARRGGHGGGDLAGRPGKNGVDSQINHPIAHTWTIIKTLQESTKSMFVGPEVSSWHLEAPVAMWFCGLDAM